MTTVTVSCCYCDEAITTYVNNATLRCGHNAHVSCIVSALMQDHQNCECPTCHVDISVGMDSDYHGFHTDLFGEDEIETMDETSDVQEQEQEQEQEQDDLRNFGIDTQNLSAILGDLSLQTDVDSDEDMEEDGDDESFLDDLERMEDDYVDIFDDEAYQGCQTICDETDDDVMEDVDEAGEEDEYGDEETDDETIDEDEEEGSLCFYDERGNRIPDSQVHTDSISGFNEEDYNASNPDDIFYSEHQYVINSDYIIWVWSDSLQGYVRYAHIMTIVDENDNTSHKYVKYLMFINDSDETNEILDMQECQKCDWDFCVDVKITKYAGIMPKYGNYRRSIIDDCEKMEGALWFEPDSNPGDFICIGIYYGNIPYILKSRHELIANCDN